MRFESKVQTAGENYHSENSKTKLDILNAKEKHDELLDSAFISLITAQVSLLAFIVAMYVAFTKS